MQYIDIYDYLLLPLYIFVFYLLVKRKSLKYTDIELRKILFTAFFLRMFGSVAYCLMVQYYYGYGDSFGFYSGSIFFREQVFHNINNIKYFFAPADEVGKWYNLEGESKNFTGFLTTPSNLFVMKLATIVSFVSFNKYLIASLFFGLFSFVGQWKLFRVFTDINKGKNQKLLAWAVLYTPSIWFWGSGLMKDSLCLGATGFIISILYKNLVKKKFKLWDFVYLILLVYLVFTIKSYIILVLAICLCTIVFFELIIQIKNIILKTIITLSIFSGILLFAYNYNATEQVKMFTEDSIQQIEAFQKNYESGNAEDERSVGEIKVKEIDPSITGIVIQSPGAILTCLFRPFIWESRKPIILFTSLESMLLLFSTLYLLYKTRFLGFFKLIFNNEYILFCFILSMLFALVIGLTTYNFGTMVRYKIILLPFYYFMLVAIYTSYLDPKKAI